jgi:hypothetical protein
LFSIIVPLKDADGKINWHRMDNLFMPQLQTLRLNGINLVHVLISPIHACVSSGKTKHYYFKGNKLYIPRQTVFVCSPSDIVGRLIWTQSEQQGELPPYQ